MIGQLDAGAGAYKLRREIPVGTPVTSPHDIACAARDDIKTLSPHDAQCALYVWVPDWIDADSGFAQVSMAVNSTFSRVATIVQPTRLCNGKLIRIDLAKYAAREDQIVELRRSRELLAEHDNYFNVLVKVIGEETAVIVDQPPAAGDVVEVQLTTGWVKATFVSRDGDRYRAKLVDGKQLTFAATAVRFRNRLMSAPARQTAPDVKEIYAAAPYLNPTGAELFSLSRSGVPIMHLHEFIAATMSTVNRGKYYQITGIKGTLQDTVREFAGNDAAEKAKRFTATLRTAAAESRKTGEAIAKIAGRLDPELGKSKALVLESGVTGRQRIIVIFFGAGGPPTAGVQLVSITFDISEENVDPNNDPFRNALNFQTYDGGEAIFALPNGLLGYLVFNAQDATIASVPDNVAFDTEAHRVRGNVATARVFSGISCMNCHEKTATNWGWQPVKNDLLDTIRGLGSIIDDKADPDQVRGLQLLASQYGGDINEALNLARLPYQRQGQLATNQRTTRETVAGLADSYWGLLYDRYTPRTAALELGRNLTDKQAQQFFIAAIESKKLPYRLLEDGVVLRLKDGKHVAPAQWRGIYQSVAERLLFADPQLEGLKP
ncbi:hypothetical protein [Anatilimnocola floriformis]|uniref:hypothetical protein n=1 Tax=Anatilimnocola floriformis TaxID=2948575 RepID=UPI0020C2D1B5|nr:hypothetical protein [Anatilimnocola floriformis]